MIMIQRSSPLMVIKSLIETKPGQKFRHRPQGRKSKSQIMGIKCNGILAENAMVS